MPSRHAGRCGAYLAALDGRDAPTNPDQAAKALSPTDPAAAWTTRGRHKVMFGYSLNYLIDTETAVIVDVEATPTRISEEVDATEIMIERTQDRFGLRPDSVAADVAYGTGKMLGWLVGRNIDPHIPVWDRSRRADETFPRSAFAYERERDLYICPGGKTMKSTGRVHGGTTLLYRSSKRVCDACLLKAQCCPTTPSRRIPRDINEDARERARILMQTQAYRRSGRRRKKIETLFGDAKRNLGLSRLRLRGLAGARDEFLLTAIVQNLRRLVGHAAMPPPQPGPA